jgi:hypothetical protein
VSQVIIAHVNECRKYSALKNARVIIMPEANIASQILNLQTTLRKEGATEPVFMTEDKASASALQRDLPGSITTRKRKRDMIDLLQTKYLKPGNIGFFFQFITSSDLTRLDDIKAEVIKEMRSFEKKKKLKINNEGEAVHEIFYNGKSNGEDDYVIAAAMGVYWKEVFFDKNSRKYSFYW